MSDVTGYIEAFYNRSRPHSAIGNQFPAACMDAFFERTAEACPEGPAALPAGSLAA